MFVELAQRGGHLDEAGVGGCLALLKPGPAPKSKGVDRRTSGKKRKSVPDHQLEKLLAWLDTQADADSVFLAAWIRFSLTFFPRPNEWDGARLRQRMSPDGFVPSLRLPNSKVTNGRSFGRFRHLDLVPDDDLFGELAKFIAEYQARTKCSRSKRKFHDQLRAALARACKQAGVNRLSPYSLRHIGMAAAKRCMDSESVSYAAGHVSDRTKVERSARSRDGGGSWLSPTEVFSVREADRLVVRVTGKATRAENMDRHCGRGLSR